MANSIPDPQSIKGLIFDYGGTIDCAGDHWAVIIREAYDTLPVPQLPLETFIDAYVFAERELARTRHILPGHNFLDMMKIKARIELERLVENGAMAPGAPAEYADAIATHCYAHARTCIDNVRPVLERLATSRPTALVSNFYGNIETVLADFGLAHLFPTVIESAVVGIRKPDPRIFGLGVEALGMKPSEVLVVGDSISKDIIPAQSIGCPTAWIKGRPWFGDTAADHSGWTIDSLEELSVLY